MVVILTLFAALVSGPQALVLSVEPPAAKVEVRLDNQVVGSLDGPPWSLTVDLGPELAPHLLTVEAWDADGAGVSSGRRWINWTPPPRQPLAGSQAGTVAPATPLPVVADDDSQWRLEDLEGVFTADHERLSPMARAEPTDGAGGVVVVVLDRRSQSLLTQQVARYEKRLRDAGVLTAGTPRALLPLRAEDRIVLLWADSAEAATGSERDLLADSPFFDLGSATPDERGFSWTLSHTWPPERSPRLADAVCVAGRLAASSGRPRAVILLALPDAEDGSLVAPAEAMRYLRRLRVPLIIWTPAEDAASVTAVWGEAASIWRWDEFDRAVARLRDLLASQTVVWFAGEHLPDRVHSVDGSGFHLAGAAQDLVVLPEAAP